MATLVYSEQQLGGSELRQLYICCIGEEFHLLFCQSWYAIKSTLNSLKFKWPLYSQYPPKKVLTGVALVPKRTTSFKHSRS